MLINDGLVGRYSSVLAFTCPTFRAVFPENTPLPYHKPSHTPPPDQKMYVEVVPVSIQKFYVWSIKGSEDGTKSTWLTTSCYHSLLEP